MTKTLLFFIFLFPALSACNQSAENFFSGRPSDMAMVHNRIIAGGLPEMVVLLQIPSRFPDATEEHVANWQGSVTAWWMIPEKQQLMIGALSRLNPQETASFFAWLQLRAKNSTQQMATILDAAEKTLQPIAAGRKTP